MFGREQDSISRRRALAALAGFAAGSPLLRGQSLDDMLTSFDFEAVAKAKVPETAFVYTAYGSDAEFTLKRNREAFGWARLVSKAVMAPVKVDASTQLFGAKLSYPILVSPSAGQVALHPEGESAMHAGATAASNTTMMLSGNTSQPVGKVAAAATSPLWYQLYPRRDFEANRPLIDDAQNAGCKAIILTVDQHAVSPDRVPRSTRRSTRGEPSNPYRVDDFRLWYQWSLFAQLRPLIKVPMIIKGVLTAEDSKLAIEHGLDAVYVSNHGGRSLDYGPSTLEVLPEIAEVVRKRVPIFFDSGIRRGSDVLKALALGANAVCLGRVPRWGLGAFGAPGVQRVLEILQAEFIHAMASVGRPTIASIDRTIVRTDFP
jgi:isopentenyl diphosphate isomerase/L-lactate dehydrogenase-like FMN-dependent dehydrogenase